MQKIGWTAGVTGGKSVWARAYKHQGRAQLDANEAGHGAADAELSRLVVGRGNHAQIAHSHGLAWKRGTWRRGEEAT